MQRGRDAVHAHVHGDVHRGEKIVRGGELSVHKLWFGVRGARFRRKHAGDVLHGRLVRRQRHVLQRRRRESEWELYLRQETERGKRHGDFRAVAG